MTPDCSPAPPTTQGALDAVDRRDPVRPLQVTIVAHHVGAIGGMERQLSMLVTGLLRRGHEVTVVSRGCELSAHPKLRWIRVRGPARPFTLAFPFFFARASWLIARDRVGVLHTTGALVANRSDLCTVHQCNSAFHRDAAAAGWSVRPSIVRRLNSAVAQRMSRWTERWYYAQGRTRHFVAVSRRVVGELQNFFPEVSHRVQVIPNGVDLTLYRPNELMRQQVRDELAILPGRLVAIFVGGAWDAKGLRFAIEAVAQASNCELLVVGAGDEGRYRNVARSRGAEERVHFVGRTSEAWRYYAAADVFVFPSAHESCPLVALEAAAAGLPLLATRVGGIEDLLIDGDNGWFVRRDAESISVRLAALVASPELCASMGARSREAAARYDWEHVIDDYVHLYRSLLPSQL